MRLPPRSPAGTWLLAAAVWLAGCGVAWLIIPPRPRAAIAEPGTHWPRAFSPDGRWFVTTSYSADGQAELRFWDAATGRPVPQPPSLSAGTGRSAISPDGRWILREDVSDTAPRSTIWDVASGRRVGSVSIDPPGVPAFSPAEALLACPEDGGEGSSRVRLLELPSLRVRADLAGARWPAAFAPDGRTLATGAVHEIPGERSYRVVLWDVAGARQVGMLALPQDPAWQLEFTPDGRRLVAMVRADINVINAPPSFTVMVWDLPAGRELVRVEDESPLPVNRSDLLVTIDDQRLRGYDLDTGTLRYSVYHGFSQEDVPSVSAAGGRVAGGGEELTVLTRCRQWLQNHRLPVRANSEYRSFVSLVDAATGRPDVHMVGVKAPLLSPDGRTLAVMTGENVTQFWDLPLPSATGRFVAAAALLAVPVAGLAWRRTRRLRKMA
jgi:WD40 repeat protein